jgi:hypothetical protein
MLTCTAPRSLWASRSFHGSAVMVMRGIMQPCHPDYAAAEQGWLQANLNALVTAHAISTQQAARDLVDEARIAQQGTLTRV